MKWLRRLLIKHKWAYRNSYDRTCEICGRHEVSHCADISSWSASWWEIFDKGNENLHPIMGTRYVYGHLKDWQTTFDKVRLDTVTGRVQFRMWKAGEQGHKEDFYQNMGPGWEKRFVPDES